MKAKLLKKIRRQYYIGIVKKELYKGNAAYVGKYSYEYAFAHKEKQIHDTVFYFSDLIVRVYGSSKGCPLIQKRNERISQMIKARWKTKLYNETIQKLNI